MAERLLDRMSQDLRIFPFTNETAEQHKIRLLYSATSCWIKAAATDNVNADTVQGVSRRYLFERSRGTFDAILKLFPECSNWFELDKSDTHPVILLRSRLLRHGDLLNQGFGTNVALSKAYKLPISNDLQAVYGIVLAPNIEYSGIATVERVQQDFELATKETARHWLSSFLRKIWWASKNEAPESLQYFSPFNHAKSNYLAWQDSAPESVDGVLFARTVVQHGTNEYFLIGKNGSSVHKLDSFLQQQGYHHRIMYAMRSIVNNSAQANVVLYNDHATLQLFSFLPAEEMQILESYAWPARSFNDSLQWTMSIPVWAYFKPFLLALGIEISEEQHG